MDFFPYRFKRPFLSTAAVAHVLCPASFNRNNTASVKCAKKKHENTQIPIESRAPTLMPKIIKATNRLAATTYVICNKNSTHLTLLSLSRDFWIAAYAS